VVVVVGGGGGGEERDAQHDIAPGARCKAKNLTPLRPVCN
jgi:hypothetical protein